MKLLISTPYVPPHGRIRTFRQSKVITGIIGGTVLALVGLMPATSTAASFDCAKAQSPVEKAICKDAELGLLDEQLSAAYKLALKVHPLPAYVKARQRDWLQQRNENFEPTSGTAVARLKSDYRIRIRQLSSTEKLTVYANTTEFGIGDAVVEFYEVGNDTRVSVWGGFVVHRLASEERGEPVYTGCLFEGIVKPGRLVTAVADDDSSLSISFEFSGDRVTVVGEGICEGYGAMPDELRRIPNRP